MRARLNSMWIEWPGRAGKRVILTAAAVLVTAIVTGTYFTASAVGTGSTDSRSPAGVASSSDEVQLSDTQLQMISIDAVSQREFPLQREAVGNIGFNEEMSVQVFTPYPGRIIKLFATIGDNVKKGQTLFTIESPDLIQAESTSSSSRFSRLV